MTRQANKWTDERDREQDYDRVAIVPHFSSLDDDDWFLPDIGVAPGAKIDSRTFSIAADVCQDGTGIWCDRPVTPAGEEAERQRERVLNQEREDRVRAAAKRARAAVKASRPPKPEPEPEHIARFVVDESAGFFDLVRGVFPTNPKEIWRGMTTTGRKVSVRGNGETFYGWPGENK